MLMLKLGNDGEKSIRKKRVRDKEKSRIYAKLWRTKNRERHLAYRKTYYYRVGKPYERIRRAKAYYTLNGSITNFLGGIKKRSRKLNLPTDIDRLWLKEHLEPMVCEATGMKLRVESDDSVFHTALRPSIDRIDNSKGYTKDNCRIVSVMFNRCKGENSDKEVFEMCKAFIDRMENNN